MKASIRLLSNYKDKNNCYRISLVVSHKGKQKRKAISQSIKEDWNEKKSMPRFTHPDYENLSALIMELINRSETLEFKNTHDLDLALIYLMRSQEKAKNFYEYANMRVKDLQRIGKESTADSYVYALKEFKRAHPAISFKDITRKTIVEFIDFKKKEGTASNSGIRNYISTIRAIYNYIWQRYDLENKHPFVGHTKMLPVNKRKIVEYLDYESIEKLKKAKLKQASYQKAVDLFLLQFYLGGQSFVDIFNMKWEYLVKDRFIFSRQKMSGRGGDVNVYLFEQARDIIDKYKGKDNVFVFPWRKSSLKTARDNYKRDLRLAFNVLEVSTLPLGLPVNSKCPRYTFATIGKFKGIREDILREIMGHERKEVDTMYKQSYPESVKDEAHKRIIYGLD